ncbi:MAG: polysaccharide deacetylase family protein [Armatimonadetes bacterium]|nr:polysaccharide deacetylase family protein [Armatimonadota bacterium]
MGLAILGFILADATVYYFRSQRSSNAAISDGLDPEPPRPADPTIPADFYGQVFRSEARGNPQNAICLTFDDGPSATYTPQVLDLLKEKMVTATFFVVGRNVKRHPDLVLRAYQEGHIVGNHSFNHTRRKRISEAVAAWQVDGTAKLIEEITGERPCVYRPPFGRVHNNAMTNAARARYYAIIMWTIDSRDSAHASAWEIVLNCLRNLRGGDLLLFHDGGEHREPMVEALPIIIDGARSKGLQFVTVPEILRLTDFRRKEPGPEKHKSLPLPVDLTKGHHDVSRPLGTK